MKPVHQTVFGNKGNCMSACLASLFELRIEEVPNFHDAAESDAGWWAELRKWLRNKGYGVLSVSLSEDALPCMDGYLIVCGQSTRDRSHATIWKKGSMVHDPHPDGTGLAAVDSVDLLYPLDPADLFTVNPRL